MPVKDYPVIKFTIIFILGILSARIFHFGLYVSIIFLLILMLVWFFKNSISLTLFNFISSLLFILFIFSLSNFYSSISEKKENKFFSNLYSQKNIQLFGTVERIDLRKNDLIQFYVLSDSIKADKFFVKDRIRFLCQLGDVNDSVETRVQNLSPGNYIEFSGDFYKGRNKRNPGEFDYNEYLNSIGVTGIVKTYSFDSIKIINAQEDFLSDFIYRIRIGIDHILRKYYEPQTASLLRGLLLADRRGIDYETKEQFVNAGVIHVLAVSGLHVGYIALIFLLIFGRFNLFVKAGLTILGLLLFVLITGGPPSVVRASVMAIVIIFAFVSGRSTNIFNSLAIAALIILLFDASEIYSAGFQLSFSAVLSIAIIYPIFKKKINSFIHSKFWNYVFLFGAVSLSAQIGTLPFTLLYFGKLSIIALFANLAVIPLIGFILSIGIATLTFSFIPFVASAFASANDLLTYLLFGIVNFSGKLTFSHIIVRQFNWIDVLTFYLFTILMMIFIPRFKSIKAKLLLIIFCFFNIILYSTISDVNLLPENELSVIMIDVGQGDSFLIKFPNGKTALVDAGDVNYYFDNGERVVKPLLSTLGIEKIDYGFISHMDTDHYGGFVSLILDHKIKIIYKPPFDSSSVKDSLFEALLTNEGVKVKHYKNEIIKVGNSRIYSLYNRKASMLDNLEGNNNSGVLKVVYGNSSILFTGDIESKAEKLYSDNYNTFLKCDVLKSPHHGSNTSSSYDFLENVNPKICLISAGINNKFHHPSYETLLKLNSLKIKIYRTDLSSAVLLHSDGDDFKLKSWENNF